jgi:hypothetical protein
VLTSPWTRNAGRAGAHPIRVNLRKRTRPPPRKGPYKSRSVSEGSILCCWKKVEDENDENDDEDENDWGSGGGELRPTIAGIVCIKATDLHGFPYVDAHGRASYQRIATPRARERIRRCQARSSKLIAECLPFVCGHSRLQARPPQR